MAILNHQSQILSLIRLLDCSPPLLVFKTQYNKDFLVKTVAVTFSFMETQTTARMRIAVVYGVSAGSEQGLSRV